MQAERRTEDKGVFGTIKGFESAYMTKVRVINKNLLDEDSSQAKTSPRLRMNRRYKLVCSLPRREGGKAKLNYNFHQSLDDKCHRMLNAVEPGTDIPIHRHPDKDESFVILRGKVRSTTYNDDGSVIDIVVLSQEDGIYGVDIPQGVWHKLESLEPDCREFQ